MEGVRRKNNKEICGRVYFEGDELIKFRKIPTKLINILEISKQNQLLKKERELWIILFFHLYFFFMFVVIVGFEKYKESETSIINKLNLLIIMF